jgi:hypothetical protein
MIGKIITNHVHAIEAITTNSMDSLDHATLCSSSKNAINLTHTLHSSNSLTNWFTTMVTENKDHTFKCDTAIADHNTLTAR